MGKGKISAVIIAGGKGERLKSISRDVPKPMMEIAGKPILEHQVNLLRDYGITGIYMMTGYLGHVIHDHFGDGKTFGVDIRCYKEETPLGTSGCFKILEEVLYDEFLVLYGDVMLDMNLDDFISFHQKKGSCGTLAVHPNDHPFDSDLVVLDDEDRIEKLLLKNQKPKYYRNLASAAAYILSPEVFKYIPDGASDFMKNVFPEMLEQSEELYGYKTAEYIKDMGTVERLEKVTDDYLCGKIKRRSKKNKRAAIFMDRDGTLVKDVDLLHKIEDLELLPCSADAVRSTNSSDFLSFMITNQPVVARNLCDISMVNQIHNKFETLLGNQGAYLNDIYFCPHHPDKGYPEENPAYKIDCDCRKPKTGMVRRAVQDYNVDIESSWFIGDTTTDIQTGVNAGLRTILVRTGRGGKDRKYQERPDFVFDNIKEATEFILNGTRAYDDTVEKILNHLVGAHKEAPYVILVGGPSRSGKSTFVQWLKVVLSRHHLSCAVIELDNWLLGMDQRTPSMTVRDRYKYPEIEKDVSKLLKGEKIVLNLYDPYSRKLTEPQENSLEDEQCIIIVGVPALDIPGLRAVSDMSIYLEVDELKRRERFFAFYHWKDLSDEIIEELYEKRMEDEFRFIESSKAYADHVLTNS